MIAVTSRRIARIPALEVLLDAPVIHAGRFMPARSAKAVAGWGCKRSGRRARALARRWGVPARYLEDGFLRSYGTGEHFPPLSLVVDEAGIYYDAGAPSSLERLLNSERDLMVGIGAEVARAKALILEHRLSKYNHAPMLEALDGISRWFPNAGRLPEEGATVQRVLVVDQTAGDLSVSLGMASGETFAAMLKAAREENPHATIYVKTHPEVSAGRKGGYLTAVQEDGRTVVLREAVNPLSLIEQMDRVYVVSSTMGFEALLAGKPVSVFGMPWYAGWGVTDDRQRCGRRTRQRSLDELFAAAYFHYSRYLNPYTRERGTIFDVIDWLVRQREGVARLPSRCVMVHGRQFWRRDHLRPMLSMASQGVRFVRDGKAARQLGLRPGDGVIVWGRDLPGEVQGIASTSGARLLHLEDGFFRSVGLGSDLIRPRSLVIDELGLYFDPRSPSALEALLNTTRFSEEELHEARTVRELILEHGLTKYNIEPRDPLRWPSAGREVVLVPGQVEDDASIRHGCEGVKGNLALMQAARAACPDAFIVFKPHPDVFSGNRHGRVGREQALEHVDYIEEEASVVACIEGADRVHTMTSMAGFEALLRGKPVVVYGRPFYAGWGLTEDRLELPRRQRRLSLDELIAGTLLRYPIYWDWELRGFTRCKAVLRGLQQERDRLQASGRLEGLRTGRLRRLLRKGRAFLKCLVKSA